LLRFSANFLFFFCVKLIKHFTFQNENPEIETNILSDRYDACVLRKLDQDSKLHHWVHQRWHQHSKLQRVFLMSNLPCLCQRLHDMCEILRSFVFCIVSWNWSRNCEGRKGTHRQTLESQLQWSSCVGPNQSTERKCWLTKNTTAGYDHQFTKFPIWSLQNGCSMNPPLGWPQPADMTPHRGCDSTPWVWPHPVNCDFTWKQQTYKLRIYWNTTMRPLIPRTQDK